MEIKSGCNLDEEEGLTMIMEVNLGNLKRERNVWKKRVPKKTMHICISRVGIGLWMNSPL